MRATSKANYHLDANDFITLQLSANRSGGHALGASFGRKIRVLVSGLSMPNYMQISRRRERPKTHTLGCFAVDIVQ
jgi:hypothetical protein